MVAADGKGLLERVGKMQLPINLTASLQTTRWKAILDPILQNPLNNVSILKNVKLVNGVNVINHKLGRVQQGWFITDIDAAATIYRSENFNDKTLTLTSSADCTISLGVF
jgi:acetyltransferase-like isoleucine patch superfamily enzyme